MELEFRKDTLRHIREYEEEINERFMNYEEDEKYLYVDVEKVRRMLRKGLEIDYRTFCNKIRFGNFGEFIQGMRQGAPSPSFYVPKEQNGEQNRLYYSPPGGGLMRSIGFKVYNFNLTP